MSWAEKADRSRRTLALAVSHWIEDQTGWPVRKFVKTTRRSRTLQIQARPRTITAAGPLPEEPRQALEAINHAASGRAAEARQPGTQNPT